MYICYSDRSYLDKYAIVKPKKSPLAVMVDCVADHLPVVLCAQVNCKISQDNQAINRR